MPQNMKSDRWTMKDKLVQFRGITRLHQLTVSHAKNVTLNLRKKQFKEIKDLNKQNEKYRQDYGLSVDGDRGRLVPVLQSHPTLQLAYQNLNPKDMEENLKQITFSKKKELDRLNYKIKHIEEVFLSLKLELAELQNATAKPVERIWREQELANDIQQVAVKQNAADAISEASINMINILKKDTIRFDQVLEELKRDSDRQCQCILKATKMGLEASRELAKLQDEYNTTEKHVRSGMKERDRAIRNMKAEIENIKLHHAYIHTADLSQEATRAPVVHVDNTSENIQDTEDMILHKGLAELTDILTELQDVTLVPKFQDIFPRIMEQLKHKARLQKHVAHNEEQIARMLKLRNSMDVLLEVVYYHTLTEEAVSFKAEKSELKRQISQENVMMLELQKEIEAKGETILQARTALITLNILLCKVCPIHDETAVHSGEPEREITPGTDYPTKPLIQPKIDAIYMLNIVTEKLKWVMNQIRKRKGGLVPPTRAPMRMTHDSIAENILEDEYDTIVSAMLDELSEIDDPSVPTRKDIKEQSQKLVEQFEDPRAQFRGPTGPQYKKHSCF